MEITLRKGVFIFIGLVVFLVIILIFLGGLNKIQAIWDEMFGENVKDPSGTGALGDCPADLSVLKNDLGLLFEEAKNNKNNRCLIKFEALNGNKLPDLRGYKIHLESHSNGVIVGLTKGDSSPQKSCTYPPKDGKDNYVIEGIWPCAVGQVKGEAYEIFKKNWFYNYPTIDEGEFLPSAIKFMGDGRFQAEQGGEPRTEDELDGFYFYKTQEGGKTYLCVIEDEQDEEKDLLRRIPLCDYASGPDYGTKEMYTCTINKNGRTNNEGNDEINYYFKENEYYCDNDNIYYCDGQDGKFYEINEDEISEKKECEGDQKPYNKQDDCCCLTKNPDGSPGRPGQCIRYSFPEDYKNKMVESCSDLGPFWEQQKCPEDISYRVGYVDRNN